MSIATVFALPVACTALSVAGAFFLESPLRGAGLMLATYVVETVAIEFPRIPMGITVFPQDIVFGLLLAAGIWRYLLRRAPLDRSRVLILGLMLLLLLSLARGISMYGAKTAGVEVRGFFWFFSGSLYFSSFPYGRRTTARLIRQWHLAACALLAIAVFRWIATGVHLPIAQSWADPGQPAMRVLNSNGALFLCVAFFFSIFLHLSRTGAGWQRKLYLVLGPSILLLQHRTVWIVALAGLAILFREHAQSLRKVAVTLAAMLAFGIVLLFATFGADFVLASLLESATSSDTLLWRVAGWWELLANRNTGFTGFLIGDPFGAGFARMIGHTRVEVSPHNFYVQTFLRLGILGLVLVVWLYGSQLRACRTLAAQPSTRFSARVWQVFLLFHLIYFMTYNLGYEQSLVLGMIAGGIPSLEALARARKTLPVRSRLPDRSQLHPLPGNA